MIDICSLLELELDFAEEDVEFAERTEIIKKIEQSIQEIKILLSTYDRTRILREGVRLVITGKPNVGKSSLLNALVKEERAIVTKHPGTTRDTLEEQIDIRGVFFRVVDTAGVRTARDEIEQIGVERTLQQIKMADIILFLFDCSKDIDNEDMILIDYIRKNNQNAKICALINKIDLKRTIDEKEIVRQLVPECVVSISVKEHSGFELLEKTLIELVFENDFSFLDQGVVSNTRQKMILEKTVGELKNVVVSLKQGLSSEFIASDLKQATDRLGEIIGDVASEDILDNIFSKFCVGK
jgi:tRNA modification GTPase